MIDSRRRIEERLLEEMFLDPGQRGPIKAIVGTADAVVRVREILGQSNGSVAKGLARLFSEDEARSFLSGRRGPTAFDWPSYLPLLLVTIYSQCEKEIIDNVRRPNGEQGKNIRVLMECALGYYVDNMNGLPDLWEALRDFLGSRDVVLKLPDVYRHALRVSHSLRLAFPTGWDLVRIEKALRELPKEHLDDVERVARRFDTVREEEGGGFDYQKADWLRLVSEGYEADDHPFARAIRRVRRKLAGTSDLQVVVGRGIGRLTVVNEDLEISYEELEERTRSDPELRLRPSIEASLRGGAVWMEDCDYGLWRSTSERARCDGVLFSPSFCRRQDDVDLAKRAPIEIGGGWRLAETQIENTRASSKPNILRTKGGIRAGSAMLARRPFIPWVALGDEPPVVIRTGDKEVDLQRDGLFGRPTIERCDGTMVIEGRTGGEVVSAKLDVRSSALPHSRADVRTADSRSHRMEDGDLFDTVPGPEATRVASDDDQQPTDETFKALAEALYARSARGIPLSVAFAFAEEVRGQDDPASWDLLAAFVDGGWFDHAWSDFGQMLFLRTPTLRRVGMTAVIEGALCEALEEKLCRICSDIGVNIVRSTREWSVPAVTITDASPTQLDEVSRRARIGVQVEPEAAAASILDLPVVDIRKEVYSRKRHFGLTRLTPNNERGAPYWAIDSVPGGTAYRSRIVAGLVGAERSSRSAFEVTDGAIVRLNPYPRLPASWARWARRRSGISPGPTWSERGAWEYRYPIDAVGAALVGRLLPGCLSRASEPAWLRRIAQPYGKRTVVVRDAISSVA